MADERQRVGTDGERAAAAFLRGRGYTIVERNFRCPVGEVDLIALDRRTVVFVEVKTRSHGDPEHTAALGAVHPRKQRRLRRAAEWYLAAHRLEDRPVRFDVVAVWADGGTWQCRLVVDAFEGEGEEPW